VSVVFLQQTRIAKREYDNWALVAFDEAGEASLHETSTEHDRIVDCWLCDSRTLDMKPVQPSPTSPQAMRSADVLLLRLRHNRLPLPLQRLPSVTLGRVDFRGDDGVARTTPLELPVGSASSASPPSPISLSATQAAQLLLERLPRPPGGPPPVPELTLEVIGAGDVAARLTKPMSMPVALYAITPSPVDAAGTRVLFKTLVESGGREIARFDSGEQQIRLERPTHGLVVVPIAIDPIQPTVGWLGEERELRVLPPVENLDARFNANGCLLVTWDWPQRVVRARVILSPAEFDRSGGPPPVRRGSTKAGYGPQFTFTAEEVRPFRSTVPRVRIVVESLDWDDRLHAGPACGASELLVQVPSMTSK